MWQEIPWGDACRNVRCKISAEGFNPGVVGSPNPSELAILLRKGINPLLTGNTEDFERLIKLCFAEPPFIPSQFKKVLTADAVAHRDFNKKIWDDMVGNLTKEASSSRENFLKPYLPKI